ncbi:GNAT family N-acetyltransferase [Planctomicrobium sp. SH661]|uniref:GNAT family N-acetyltransferase n=1 Tax=Planctomicrobium sp. SH661 TaxID=3448124 RepID=UPI003F5B5EC3
MTSLTTSLPFPQTTETLHCRIVSSESAEQAMATWREIEARQGSSSLASGATWTENWIQVYGNVVPYRFLIAEAGGVPRGICLLTTGTAEKVGPFPIRTLHLGTAGEPQPGSVCVEYNRILVEPRFQGEFISQVAAAIKQDRTWEQLRLDGFSEADLAPWLPHFPNAEVRSRDSRYFDLKAAREHAQPVIERLGKSTRSNLRRRLKQYGDLQCEWAETIEQAEDILTELITLHQARWQAVGQPGAFASERFLKFQTTTALKLFLEQKSVLFRVRHQSETVGCLYLLVDDNRLLDYLSGFADFNVKPSPGLTTHYLCMEAALQRGYDAYDFLVGDKRHKENLSSDVNQLCWLTWSRPSFKLTAIELLRKLKQRFARGHQTTNDSSSPEQTSGETAH